MALPRPDDLTSLVLRTDLSDDTAWDALRAAFDAADEEEQLTYVFLADAKAPADGPERFLLAVDLYDEPGRTVRVPPVWFPDMSANLSIADLDFADFADCADATGTFRGWDG
ncbi:hypothetical protein ABZ464_02510 [Streptomyces sp. NPDC005820]|uniref:DUF6924 domain-containing protein n=1 Tax=Streptomyces sp. NPDC005820 TaxID=3157069 RepID=UPI0033D1DF36